jgi:hypothetical protein
MINDEKMIKVIIFNIYILFINRCCRIVNNK